MKPPLGSIGCALGVVLAATIAACGTDADESTQSSEAAIAAHPAVPLHTVPVPTPQGGDIVDRAAAVRLGKAFFWDMQAGGDGKQACATCHFTAGIDRRRRNTMNPGPNGTFESNGVTGPGQVAADVNASHDDRVGSQGVVWSHFEGLASDPHDAADMCTPTPAPPFLSERRVTARNAPTVINTVFFRENFWDGRAHHVFNGRDPFGTSANGAGGPVAIENGSLASQATGPASDEVEMACAGRPFNGPSSLGAKLLARPPLQFQRVSPTDSVLGEVSAAPDNGLRCGAGPCSYRELISAAFGPELAAIAEQEFSRLWGQAIAAYEATLIADETPLDRYLAGDRSALTESQRLGLDIFRSKGGCFHCHAGGELSDATFSFAERNGLVNEDGGDQGFHNIGVRPVAFYNPEDLGRAGVGPKGRPYSVSGGAADRGAFKTPSLRNVKLTAPYFHNGGKATLADVVAFYAQGGDFHSTAQRLKAITFFHGEADALVDFLTNALTDCRTEKELAPFDHPSIEIPNGPTLEAVGAGDPNECPPPPKGKKR
jgi:cytochrome c peroxidase